MVVVPDASSWGHASLLQLALFFLPVYPACPNGIY